jgi:nucleoid DNA-binding protein
LVTVDSAFTHAVVTCTADRVRTSMRYKPGITTLSSNSNMNRVELVEILTSKNDLSKAAANAVLETLIDTIQSAVKKGDAVQLVGFGTFKSVERAARTGKNPATGAALKIPASTVPKFVAGAKFKAVVDPKAAKRKAEKAGK